MKQRRLLSYILMIVAVLMLGLNVQAATKVRINKKAVSIKTGKTVQLKVTGTKKRVKWVTSNKKIATVTQKGKVTGKKPGKVTITAKVEGKKLSCKVEVKAVYVNKITIKPGKKIIMYVGDKKTIKATAYPRNATNTALKFSTDDIDIVSVSKNGIISAKSEGEAYVWVEAKDAGEVGVEIEVIVKKREANKSQSINVWNDENLAALSVLLLDKSLNTSDTLILKDIVVGTNSYKNGYGIMKDVQSIKITCYVNTFFQREFYTMVWTYKEDVSATFPVLKCSIIPNNAYLVLGEQKHAFDRNFIAIKQLDLDMVGDYIDLYRKNDYLITFI